MLLLGLLLKLELGLLLKLELAEWVATYVATYVVRGLNKHMALFENGDE